MRNTGPWTKHRKLGLAALAAVIAGWVTILCVQTLPSVCTSRVTPFFWSILFISLTSPIAFVWAAVKDKWWWALGLMPAILLLLTFMGTFEGC